MERSVFLKKACASANTFIMRLPAIDRADQPERVRGCRSYPAKHGRFVVRTGAARALGHWR